MGLLHINNIPAFLIVLEWVEKNQKKFKKVPIQAEIHVD